MEKKQSPEKYSFRKINWIVIILNVVLLYALNDYFVSSKLIKTIDYSEFLRNIDEGTLLKVTLTDGKIFGEYKRPKDQKLDQFVTISPKDDKLIEKLYAHNVPFSIEAKNLFLAFFTSWVLPLIIFYFFWMFLSRRFGGAQKGLLSLTKSHARSNLETNIKTTFADVAGIDEAKDELLEVVNFLQNPMRYSRLGGRAPKGVLLVGPPGTGKTLLARALAGEAKVPFFSINGSEFVEMFVGLGAARVRDLFQEARKEAPCILFIDEIDALGKSRALGMMGAGGNDEKEQTLNQLLAEMDGFDTSEGVIMLAATNRPEILDPALLRAGRFDRQILLGNPDLNGRLQILGVHSKKIKLDVSIDLKKIASLTPGFSGADLANLVNEAAVVATRRNADAVSEKDFSEAIERLVAGLEKKTKVMNWEEKRRVAFHELGHATVALELGVPDKVQKISIIPRGLSALGYTFQRPFEDRYLLDEQELMNKISVLLGGRAAESLFFPKVSTGATDDLVKASDIAKSMVMHFGMSSSLGLESFNHSQAHYLQSQWDYTMSQVAPETAREIDQEVKSILEKSFQVAIHCLKKNRIFIEHAAKELLENETLDESQIGKLWTETHQRLLESSRIHNA
jgi:cell division protease FtsH